MDSTDFAHIVSDMPFGEELSDGLKLQLIGIFVETGCHENHPGGTHLLVAGDRQTNHGYVLLSGNVVIEENERPAKRCSAPHLLGEAKQFSLKCERVASVTTLGPVDVLRFDWDAFEKAVQRHLDPEAQRQITEALFNYTFSH